MTCQKCKLALCLLQDRKCFIAFYTWKVPMLILLHSFIMFLFGWCSIFCKIFLFTLRFHYSLYSFSKNTFSGKAFSLLSLRTLSLKRCHLIKCGSNLRSSISVDIKLPTLLTLNKYFPLQKFLSEKYISSLLNQWFHV